MRVIQISDSHLRGDDKLSFRVVDTKKCVEVAAAHLKTIVEKDDILVITGDLADCGDLFAYNILYDTFAPLGIAIYAVPGNHDHRGRMCEVLTAWCPADIKIAPHICYTVEAGNLRLVMVDSSEPGSHSGHCSVQVAKWLETTLAEQPDKATLLFMHHPPFLTGFGLMDEVFENEDIFAAILRKNPQVRLCCGHMHRPIFTMYQGCFAATAPSLSMQIAMNISAHGGDHFVMETPGYLLHHWHEGACNTHVCQIPSKMLFDGPYPFVDSVNPKL